MYTARYSGITRSLEIHIDPFSGLCSSNAWWSLVPYYRSWATKESEFYQLKRIMLGIQDFSIFLHWTPFNFCQSIIALIFCNLRQSMLYLFINSPRQSRHESSSQGTRNNTLEKAINSICLKNNNKTMLMFSDPEWTTKDYRTA